METNDLIKVLWVEDDPEVIFTYPLDAENYELELVPVDCWDDARIQLENKFNQWSAIILDAKCKYHRGSEDNAIVFLREALDDISTICERKGRIIPWYVLTGGDKSEVSDSINDKRMKWDADWTMATHKKYYSKNVDNESLYSRIKSHAQKSPRFQIIEMYYDIFEQLKRLDNYVYEDIATIFEAMYFPKSHPDFNPRLFFNPLRRALEYIFRALRDAGIIPEAFFDRGNVNLNQCFMFLIGRDAEKLGYRYGTIGEKVVPRHINAMMSLIINLGNSNSHSTEQSHLTELSEDEIQKYDSHIKSMGSDSRLLIFSIALQFCEITQWMNNYIVEHPNRDANLKKCVKLENEERDGAMNSDLTGIVEREKGYFHVGGKYCLNPKTIQQNGWLGKRIRILHYVNNTNERTKDLFPLFANSIQLIEEPENGSK